MKGAKLQVAYFNLRFVMQPGDVSHAKNTAETRERRANEGKAWSVDEEQELHGAFWKLKDIRDLSVKHARTSGAIQSRLKVLGLLDKEGRIVSPKPGFSPSRVSLSRVALQDQLVSTLVKEKYDESRFLGLFYRLPLKQRAIVMEVARGLLELFDQNQ